MIKNLKNLYSSQDNNPVTYILTLSNLESTVHHIVSRTRGTIVVGFSTTCAISAYHHKRCEFEPRSWRGVLDTTLCDKACQ